MHSIELLLDPATDEAVRADWARLADRDLPSQARHAGASNAPHVTLLAATSFDDSHDDELSAAFSELPLPGRFGGLIVFGRAPRSLVLARGVVVSGGILRLQASVHAIAGATAAVAGLADHSRPGDWTPHVTLASRLTPDELAAAVEVLQEAPEPFAFAAARRWDGTAREVVALGPDA